MKPPIPEEFYEEMLRIKNKHNDNPEDVHIFFDKYICEVLKSYGFHKGVEVFEDTEKWYS